MLILILIKIKFKLRKSLLVQANFCYINIVISLLCFNMRLSCLITLAVISLVTVTECKPLSDDVETAPCVDCEQIKIRRKRTFEMLFKQAANDIQLNLDCPSDCKSSFSMSYSMSVSSNGSPDIYIGNGEHMENHAVINGAKNVYIGNGDHNTNYVSINS